LRVSCLVFDRSFVCVCSVPKKKGGFFCIIYGARNYFHEPAPVPVLSGVSFVCLGILGVFAVFLRRDGSVFWRCFWLFPEWLGQRFLFIWLGLPSCFGLAGFRFFFFLVKKFCVFACVGREVTLKGVPKRVLLPLCKVGGELFLGWRSSLVDRRGHLAFVPLQLIIEEKKRGPFLAQGLTHAIKRRDKGRCCGPLKNEEGAGRRNVAEVCDALGEEKPCLFFVQRLFCDWLSPRRSAVLY